MSHSIYAWMRRRQRTAWEGQSAGNASTQQPMRGHSTHGSKQMLRSSTTMRLTYAAIQAPWGLAPMPEGPECGKPQLSYASGIAGNQHTSTRHQILTALRTWLRLRTVPLRVYFDAGLPDISYKAWLLRNNALAEQWQGC